MKARVFSPPHRIAKVVKEGGPDCLSEAGLLRADKALRANLNFDYIEHTNGQLAQASAILDRLSEPGAKPDAILPELVSIIHEMRGVGGTLGYPLITAIGSQLYEILDDGRHAHKDVIVAIRLHIDAIEAVLREDLSGDGGARGTEILSGLKSVYQKFK